MIVVRLGIFKSAQHRKTEKSMPKLSSSKRAGLPDSAFAYVDSHGKRRLPIHDESHVRNALSRFNQVKFEDEAARERARKRLLNAARKYGIVPVGFMTGQLQSERQKTEQLRKDLDEAQSIQAGLIPESAPGLPHFTMCGVCLPSQAVGGDWFDYLTLPDGRGSIVLADVSGKGMGAALLMSSTRSILRMHAEGGEAPGAVLSEVNRVLVSDLPASKFVTMIYAILDPALRRVTFANAGHLPPIFVDADGARAINMKSQLPLGVREVKYLDCELEMSEGSRLFLYSDGVIEARNPASEEYGELRLLHYAGTASASVQGLLDEISKFTKGQPPVDDLTVVMVEGVK
jgi:sigma-B regulation protein RsbU (phosphoserine phosphatase)